MSKGTPITPRINRKFGEHPATMIEASIGSRVQISPGCDLWARGARYGAIRGAELDAHGREVVIVCMDHPKVRKLQRFFPVDLEAIR